MRSKKGLLNNKAAPTPSADAYEEMASPKRDQIKSCELFEKLFTSPSGLFLPILPLPPLIFPFSISSLSLIFDHLQYLLLLCFPSLCISSLPAFLAFSSQFKGTATTRASWIFRVCGMKCWREFQETFLFMLFRTVVQTLNMDSCKMLGS